VILHLGVEGEKKLSELKMFCVCVIETIGILIILEKWLDEDKKVTTFPSRKKFTQMEIQKIISSTSDFDFSNVEVMEKLKVVSIVQQCGRIFFINHI
jgi:hypothetical protein